MVCKVLRWGADCLFWCNNASRVTTLCSGEPSWGSVYASVNTSASLQEFMTNNRRTSVRKCHWFWFNIATETLVIIRPTTARMLSTAVVELEAGWIMLGSDITLCEQHNDHYQSLHCRVTLVKYQGGVLERRRRPPRDILYPCSREVH